MDKINAMQPEDNYEDLNGREAIEKIKILTGKASTCFFCTDITGGQPFSVRPMSVQMLDEQGIFWFLSAADSRKNKQLEKDPHVQMLFQGSDYSDFLNIYGIATITKDKQKIRELWQPIVKTWFTEGVDDPLITVIRVEPEEGYYWDTKHNMMVGMVKRIAGAMMGKTLDDSIEGKLDI